MRHHRDLSPVIQSALTAFSIGEDVPAQLIAQAFTDSVKLLSPVRDVVLGSLMTAVMARGPITDDVVALLSSALAVDEPGAWEKISGGGRPVIVLAGSGKKGLRTFNVSTPAALIAATAGAKVIKVGSAATSSALGSRELVRALGLPEHRSAEGVRTALATCGFAFVAIEPHIPMLDRLYGGRFYAPNPFSFGLVPLASPVRGDITVFGLSHPQVRVAAEVLMRFGLADVDVLTTRLPAGRYLDEIGHTGEVRWCRVRDGKPGPVESHKAKDLTMATASPQPSTPRSAQEAIERTGELLAGNGLECHRVLVSLNAAHLLMLSGITRSMKEGVALADEIVRSGAALTTVSGALSEVRDVRPITHEPRSLPLQHHPQGRDVSSSMTLPMELP